ncbi:MAG: BlaI/MecI/CopY family transcriptional regulator [Planctomycetota bacterium]
MPRTSHPTPRELAILKVLWQRGEATVREVYEALRDELGIVQNTVQAFLRTMEDKGLVTHRLEGRSFVYRAQAAAETTRHGLLRGLLDRAFDGAMDQLVASALSLRRPTTDELARLRALIDRAEAGEDAGDAPRRRRRRS